MTKTNYSVVTYNGTGWEHRHQICASRRQAELTALEWAVGYPSEEVFVSFFRHSDGQHGYINQREGASLAGKRWTA